MVSLIGRQWHIKNKILTNFPATYTPIKSKRSAFNWCLIADNWSVILIEIIMRDAFAQARRQKFWSGSLWVTSFLGDLITGKSMVSYVIQFVSHKEIVASPIPSSSTSRNVQIWMLFFMEQILFLKLGIPQSNSIMSQKFSN